ncbi:phasin family protein [Aquibaculum arenosum]|uniref:Phasin family protein n=1 Tax=Aquibaculum arenosum TaxID=3032591 RepID=A0ABT5YHP3_9PROT|nr:phasin family protein [Fodinicurvata sp. CAU 1616]MDF2094453.1 phasin family protein [Fodinicurvata sp. CAU 1616]
MSTASSKKSTSTQDAMKPVEAAVNAGKESVEAFVKVSTDAASKQYEQAISMTQEQVEKTSASLFQNYNELTSVNQANFEAFVASSNSFAKGFEALSKQMLAMTQANMEQSLTASKKLMGAKTAQEFVDLQSEFTRGQIDKMLSESAKLTELSVQVANEAFQPLQARMHQNVEKMMKPAA